MIMASDCRKSAHSILLTARNIYNLIISKEFDNLYEKADISKRKQICEAIEEVDLERLTLLLQDDSDIAELSMRELRRVGQQLGIKAYNRLSKASLLSEIINARTRQNGDIPCQSQSRSSSSNQTQSSNAINGA